MRILIGTPRLTLVALAAAAAFAGGPAVANPTSAGALCALLDQTGLLSRKCKVVRGQKSVDIRLATNREKAAKLCPEVIKVSRDMALPFDANWRLRVFAEKGNQPLVQCAF